MDEDGEQDHDRECHGANAEQHAVPESGLFAEVAGAVVHDGGQCKHACLPKSSSFHS